MDHDDATKVTVRADPPAGGDPACWLDQVRDCCGTLMSEPHRAGCAQPGVDEIVDTVDGQKAAP